MKRTEYEASSASCPFRLVFQLGGFDRLPLHVARGISATARKRHDVIDHVTRATMGIPGLDLELMLSRLAPGDPAVAISRGARGCVMRSA
jgi:hypothetical protein